MGKNRLLENSDIFDGAMSLFLKKNTTEKGNQGHECGEDESQLVASCSIEDESSHIGPEPSSKVMNCCHKTGKETDM